MYLIMTDNKELVEKAKRMNAIVFYQLVPGAEREEKVSEVIRPNTALPEYIVSTLGIKVNVKGYDYIKYFIEKVIENPKYHKKSMTKEIYPDIAKQFGTTPARVERCMRYAIHESFNDAPDAYAKLFCKEFWEPPVNSEFIAMIAEIVD